MKLKIEALPGEVNPEETVIEVTFKGQILCTISALEGPCLAVVSTHPLYFRAAQKGLTEIHFAA